MHDGLQGCLARRAYPRGDVRQVAQLRCSKNTTLRAVVEQGLRAVLRADRAEKFVLRDASVRGRGLQAEYEGAEWARIREAAYKE